MKRIMAVYDVDPFYADRFAEFANHKETIPFTAVAFTSISRLKAFTDQQQVELLLVGDEVEDKDLDGVKVGQIIRLSETGAAKDGTPVVYKYQASDSVLREVMACYQVREQPVLLTATGRKSRVIGVYSPISRCGKTGFAVTLGQVLSRDNKVLLVSLEDFSGFGALMGTEHKESLSDLIYYYRQGGYNGLRLGSVVYNWGGLDYVPPVTYAEDLTDVSGEELAGLLGRIADDSAYEIILVDMGHFGQGIEKLLALCEVVYAPVKEDTVSAAKLEEWKTYLSESGREYLWERIRLLKLPRQRGVVPREVYLEQLLWGELGDFVRELVGGVGTAWR